ncbi:MAG: hypothetical protein A2W25_16980 [candidate division Zixibacteria bacterium RBG_16_53_22]|nr:MAG: hypothetical protein A2W25_16980 [candidate division Zixibacteria bacterium RBG_16_53_22]
MNANMTRFLILSIVAAIVVATPANGTDISGDVWGVWSLDGSPYNMIGNCRVPPESTLLIEPGVRVEASPGCRMVVDSNAVFLAVGIESDSIIFTGVGDAHWRGIDFRNSDDSSRMKFCVIQSIVTENYHNGSIRITGCDIAIENCSIRNNISFFSGGGLSFYNCNPRISQCQIQRNVATCYIIGWDPGYGGGIYLENSDAIVERCIIVHNRTSGGTAVPSFGGGIYCTNSNPTIVNCTIANNESQYNNPFVPPYHFWEPAGIYSDASNVTVVNSIIWGNRGSDLGNFGGGFEISYSDIGAVFPGAGNISIDPMFADTSIADYHLLFGSPCIDSGDPDSPLDPDSTRADMGALPFFHQTGFDDNEFLPRNFTLHQNYPNPFNARTTISFELACAGMVKLEIFDVTGARVATLLRESLDAGHYDIIWDVADISSGVFYCRLNIDGNYQSKRMVLLK